MGKYGRLISRMVGSVDYWAQAAMRRFVLDLDQRMKVQNISRASLAEKLETSPAYVTKVMRGDVNFTLETMTKLALAVGGRLHIQVVDRVAPAWEPSILRSESQCQHEQVWQADRLRQTTAASDTKRLELNLDDLAANQSPYDDFGPLTTGRAA